jgi:gas vesicle structural protein
MSADELDQVDLTLLDLVDHVLNKGVVLTGEATISVAGIDLIYLGLNVVLASVGTIEATLAARAEEQGTPNDRGLGVGE